MARGEGLVPDSVEGLVPRRECRSCEAAGRLAEHGPGRMADYVDEEVVVLSGQELGGLVVLPRRHVNGLEELSIARRARVLAAVRRAASAVREQNACSASIVARSDFPESPGHMCIHVLPGVPDSARHPG